MSLAKEIRAMFKKTERVLDRNADAEERAAGKRELRKKRNLRRLASDPTMQAANERYELARKGYNASITTQN